MTSLNNAVPFHLLFSCFLLFNTFEYPIILLDSGTNLINGDSSLFAIITAVRLCCLLRLGLGLSHQSTFASKPNLFQSMYLFTIRS